MRFQKLSKFPKKEIESPSESVQSKYKNILRQNIEKAKNCIRQNRKK